MEAHEAFQQLYEKVTPKQLAEETGLSVSTFHKWSEAGESHRMNPLETISVVTHASGDLVLVHWLCRDAGGYFVPNPAVTNEKAQELMVAENEVLTNCCETMQQISRAARDKAITPEQARLIRRCWEKLKSAGERFVHASERGAFRRQLLAWFFKLYPVYDAATPGGLI